MAKVFTVEINATKTHLISKVWSSKREFEKTESWLDEKYVAAHYSKETDSYSDGIPQHISLAVKHPSTETMIALVARKQMSLMINRSEFESIVEIPSEPSKSDLQNPEYLELCKYKERKPQPRTVQPSSVDFAARNPAFTEKLKEDVAALESRIESKAASSNLEGSSESGRENQNLKLDGELLVARLVNDISIFKKRIKTCVDNENWEKAAGLTREKNGLEYALSLIDSGCFDCN